MKPAAMCQAQNIVMNIKFNSPLSLQSGKNFYLLKCWTGTNLLAMKWQDHWEDVELIHSNKFYSLGKLIALTTLVTQTSRMIWRYFVLGKKKYKSCLSKLFIIRYGTFPKKWRRSTEQKTQQLTKINTWMWRNKTRKEYDSEYSPLPWARTGSTFQL